jgi:hypothetical protein
MNRMNNLKLSYLNVWDKSNSVIPRRWESIVKLSQALRQVHVSMDSRLRGNDDEIAISFNEHTQTKTTQRCLGFFQSNTT